MMVDRISEQQERAWFGGFDRDGEHKVRLALESSSLTAEHKIAAIKWLARKAAERDARDQERLERNEASSSEQIRLARSANTIATQARNAAIAALVVATISATVGVIALLLHH